MRCTLAVKKPVFDSHVNFSKQHSLNILRPFKHKVNSLYIKHAWVQTIKIPFTLA